MGSYSGLDPDESDNRHSQGKYSLVWFGRLQRLSANQNRPERKGFPKLLNSPQTRRMLRDIEVQNPPAVVGHHEETLEHAEGDRRDREEVHGSDRFPMVAQEGQPAFGRLGVSRRSFHPARDCSLRHVEPEHKQLPMDARRSLSWILRHHSEDQLPHCLWRLFSPHGLSDSRDRPPIHPKTGPVPTVKKSTAAMASRWLRRKASCRTVSNVLALTDAF